MNLKNKEGKNNMKEIEYEEINGLLKKDEVVI